MDFGDASDGWPAILIHRGFANRRVSFVHIARSALLHEPAEHHRRHHRDGDCRSARDEPLVDVIHFRHVLRGTHTELDWGHSVLVAVFAASHASLDGKRIDCEVVIEPAPTTTSGTASIKIKIYSAMETNFALPVGDGGRCTDRTCVPTHVKGVLYR
jgi:hypothetical protein